MIRLAFLGARAAERPFLSGADRVRIGRDAATNDLVIDDPSISLRHCQLERTPPDTYLIRDLGSANGVVIGDRRVEADRLVGGDRLRLGETQLEVALGRAQVRVLAGPQAGRVLKLEAEPLTFGAGEDNSLVLADPGVADYHAALLILPSGYELRDNTDGGGLVVNERAVSRAILAPGDTFHLGASRVRFEVVTDPRPAATLLAPPSLLEPAQPPAPADDTPQLVFLEGVRAGACMRLGDVVWFGRSEDSTVQLNDVLVSGKHCAIRRQGREYQLEDAGSTNGTVLNGHRLREGRVLRPGDRIGIGTTLIEFRGGGPAGPTAALGATMSATPPGSIPPSPQAPARQAISTSKVPILPAVEASVLSQSSEGRALASAIGYGSFAKPWRPASLLGASSARLVSAMVLFAAAIALVALSLPRR